MYREKHSRSLAKSITYRIISISFDSLFVYLFTKDASLSLGLVITLNAYRIVTYYLHERAWAHVHWGNKESK